MSSQSQASPRAGVGFTVDEKGEKDAAEESSTSRRKSMLTRDGTQPDLTNATSGHLENNSSRRNSAGASATAGKAPGEKGKEESESKRSRRQSVRLGPGSAASRKHGAKGHPAHEHSGNPSFGKVMDQSAKRINAAVHSLYRAVPKKVDEPAKKKKARESSNDNKGSARQSSVESEGHDSRSRRQSLLMGDELAIPAAKPESSGSSDSSESEEGGGGKKDQEEEVLSEDSGSDDYDFKQAALKVNALLDSLNSDTRTDIMSDLNNWYASRKQGVEEDLANLSCLDAEHQLREEETKISMASMLQSFEDKQMREVKVLVKCNRTLNLGARRKLKRRPRFAKKRGKSAQDEIDETLKAIEDGKQDARRKEEEKKKKKLKKKAEKEISQIKSDAKEEDKGGDQQNRKSVSSALGEEGATLENADSESASDDEEDDDAEDLDHRQSAEGFDRATSHESVESKEIIVERRVTALPERIEDGLDIEAARRKLKEMHDVPQRVMNQMNSEEPPAGEILQALATVQDGQMQLEIRAKLAKKACEISKAALDHITAGQPIEDADEAVKTLVEEVRVQVFGENGENLIGGPDPEELEEECRGLEQLIAKQEKEIEAYHKQRERSMRLEHDLADQTKDNDSDDDGGDVHTQPTLLKSELRDGRLEAAKANAQKHANNAPNSQRDAPPKARATINRVKNAVRMTMTKTESNASKPSGGTTAPALGSIVAGSSSGHGKTVQNSSSTGTVPSWQSNRQIQQLAERISDKETKLAKAKEVHRRMKKELALLKYCAQKSESGLDALLEDFDPSKIGGDTETSESEDDAQKPRSFGQTKSLPAGGPSRKSALFVHGGDTEPESSDRGVVAEAATAPGSGDPSEQDKRKSKRSMTMKNLENKKAEAEPSEKKPGPSEEAGAAARDKRHRQFDDKFTKEVQAFNNKKLEEAETEMKARISELQVQITRDVHNLKSEKKRQNVLKKDIKRLKKSYQAMVKKHKGAPNSLEALDKQMSTLMEGEGKLKTQIKELGDELNRQQKMLERAQAEAAENEEKRKEQVFAGQQQASQNAVADAAVNLMSQGNATISALSSALAAAPLAATASAAAGTATDPVAAAAASMKPFSGAAATAEEDVFGIAGTLVTASNALSITPRAEAAAAQRAAELDEAADRAKPPDEEVNFANIGRRSRSPSAARSCPPSASRNKDESGATSLDTAGAPTLPAAAGGAGLAASPSFTAPSASVGVKATPDKAAPEAPKAGKPTPETPAHEKSRTSNGTNKAEHPDSKSGHGVGHEDLAELVRLQSRNEEYKQEIEDTMNKMRQLRLAMKKGKGVSSEAIKEIVGSNMDEESAKPPPEYYALKKEVRMKQNEVRGLRKRWWTDHKDLDSLVDKVRHTQGAVEHHNISSFSGNQPRDSRHGSLFAHEKHGSMQSIHDADTRPDANHMEPIRRKLVEAQQDYHRSSQFGSLSHPSHAFDQDHEAVVEGHGQQQGQFYHGRRSSAKPLALGSLAAFRPVEAGIGTRYRLSSEMSNGHFSQPIAAPMSIGGITGKNITRSMTSPKLADQEEISPVRRRSLAVRKTLVAEAAGSLSQLVSGVEVGD